VATAVHNYTGSDTQDPEEQELPWQPGVLAGVEYSPYPDVELTDEEKRELKALCVKAAKRDYPARLIEVIQAWEAALFYRGFQFLIPQRGGGWLIPGESTGYGPSMQMDLALLPTNIYSSYAQIVISALTRSVPPVKFEPQTAGINSQVTAAESADKFVQVIERNNDLIMVQTDASRYLWTDGRFVYWTRFMKDGQRFGWEDEDEAADIIPENEPPEQVADQAVAAEEQAETPPADVETTEQVEEQEEVELGGEGEEEPEPMQRKPRGQEVRTAHGKLEFKLVPMMANNLSECHAVQYENEVDVSTAKGMFPKVADDIKSGSNGVTEGEIARLARINVKLGMQSSYITSDSIASDVTIQRTWFRTSAFTDVKNKEVRDSLIKKFPDGALVVYTGETFCHARNESMDDSLALGQAYSGDGQNRNALGTSHLPVQKRINNWLDLMNDFFVRAVPKKWMHNKAFDVEAAKANSNIPGDIGPYKPVPGMTADQLVFVEPQVQAPASLADFVKEYIGPLSELVTGAYPALSGGDTGSNDTAHGIAIQRDQALGRLGPTWHSIKNAEATAMRQAVRWGAKCRDGSINERIPGGETIRLEVNNMRANILCFAETDENFPETYSQKQQRLMGVFNDSAKNPALQEVLYNAANLEFLQSMIALSDLYIPQVAARNKQLGELEMLLKSGPIPNPAIGEAQQSVAAMKAQGVDPQHLMQAEAEIEKMAKATPEVSSIPIDPDVDDSETEAATLWQYLNSPEGRKDKRVNQKGFMNARLHFMEHVAQVKQKAAQATGGQGKPPSVSVNYKDVADQGEADQILSKAGIQPTAKLPAPAAPGPAMPAGVTTQAQS
jgi:hypothetical protein